MLLSASSFQSVRRTTQALCGPLAPDDYAPQSMPDASPAKWHLAHTTWFFEEFVLQAAIPGYRFHDERFRHLFNSYYEAVGPRHARPERGLLTRPTIEQVRVYRRSIDDRMTDLLERDALSAEMRRIAIVGLHHEQQHQELLLTDLKHLFSCNPLLPAYAEARERARREAPPLKFHAQAGGVVEIGHAGEGFCFDNELARHRVFLEPFRIANRAVTNGEYREFVRDGGYTQPALWLSDGWGCVQRESWRRPIYWGESLEEEFTLTGLREIEADAPVCHVSYYEADAFARWAGARLPCELEWESVAAGQSAGGTFLEDEAWHPGPARRSFQMLGDVWEWTRSAYCAYPGFSVAQGALGEYNGKFMVSQLVLRGGSCVTPRNHIRPTYRNFFPPHARWQFSGLRLADEGAS